MGDAGVDGMTNLWEKEAGYGVRFTQKAWNPARQGPGFTVIELLVVIAILGLVVAFLAPAMNRAKAKAQRISCVGRLKNIGLAHRIFATDNGDLFPWERARAGATNLSNFPVLENLSAGEQVVAIFRSLSNELSTPKLIVCPADTRKEALLWAGLSTNNISYFLGTSAQETYPQSIMAGDRNLTIGGQRVSGVVRWSAGMGAVGWDGTMHRFQGNVVMGDGSVQQLSAARWREQMRNTGVETNAFIFP